MCIASDLQLRKTLERIASLQNDLISNTHSNADPLLELLPPHDKHLPDPLNTRQEFFKSESEDSNIELNTDTVSSLDMRSDILPFSIDSRENDTTDYPTESQLFSLLPPESVDDEASMDIKPTNVELFPMISDNAAEPPTPEIVDSIDIDEPPVESLEMLVDSVEIPVESVQTQTPDHSLAIPEEILVKNEIEDKKKGLHYCETCNKVFNQSSDLKRHIRIHTGEKPYMCHICGKGFTQVNDVQKHLRVHTGDKPYQCHICGKEFTQLSNVKKHVESHTGNNIFLD